MFLKAPKAFIVLLSKLQSIIKQKQITELPIFMKTAPTKKFWFLQAQPFIAQVMKIF